MSRLLSSGKIIFMRLYRRLLGRLFHALYTSFAWFYNGIAALVSLGRWRKWVQAILPYANASPLLELGCGPGHLQIALRQRSMAAFGIDASRQMCRLAGNNHRKNKFASGIVHASAEAIPFQDSSFACILSTFPTPFIFSADTVREVHRLLKPGGMLVVLLSARLNLRRRAGRQKPDDSAIERLLAPYRSTGLIARLEWQAAGKDDLLFLFIEKSTSGLKDSEIKF